MAASITHLTTSSNGADPKRRHANGSNEPLQRFGEAKKWMADIYAQLNDHINELHEFYSGLTKNDPKFVPAAQLGEVERFRDSIKAIREMVGRDKMKVVFFGRTSNGKSSVVNAMLASRVLPQGMGHTTCCFLQVEGGAEQDKHFMMENGDERMPISELNTVGHALGTKAGGLGRDSLIRVFYPKSASKLLQNDVLIVDSPGVDLSPEFDSWIDKHCLDADVFVLVSNSESTLTQAEKNFFMRVSKKLSRPNIFILCNRWDASASETEDSRAQIRQQHEQRFEHFLVHELQVCAAQEAKNRYFFISAREMLDSRLREKGELKSIPYQQDGFQRRALEFKQFEEQFEKCISKSAIRTKFEAHNRRARDIVIGVQENLDTVLNSTIQEKKRLALDFQLKTKEFATSRENFKHFERTYNAEQRKLRAEVHMKVSADFLDEISRLEAIIDRFKHPFGDDMALLAEYKQELATHVNNIVTEELQNQCTGGLMAQIWSLEQSMHAFVKQILTTQHASELDKIWNYKQPFKFAITVNCPQLVSDFHEDLEFRFSLGIENIARWVLSITRGQPITSIDRNVLRLGSPRQPDQKQGTAFGYGQQQQPDKREVDVFLSNVVVQSATYLMNGSVGVAIVGLVVYKNVDWRWVLGGIGLVSGLYAFERLRWDNGAKEERLKAQFRQHLEQRLHQTESIHTSQCEQQVIHELDQVYGGLRTVVGGFHREMKEGIDRCKREMDSLDGTIAGISTIKNKTNFVNSTLDAFTERFLAWDSP